MSTLENREKMSYSMKFQSSTGSFRSIINKINISKNNYTCKSNYHCLLKCTNLRKSDRNSSTFSSISALKLLLKRQKKISDKVKHKNVFTELMKVSNNKSVKKKIKILPIKPSDVQKLAENSYARCKTEDFKNGHVYSSIRCYDPNLLIPSDGVVKFVENLLKENVSPDLDETAGSNACTKKNKNHNFKNNSISEITKANSNECFHHLPKFSKNELQNDRKISSKNNERERFSSFLIKNNCLPEGLNISPHTQEEQDLDALASSVEDTEEESAITKVYDDFEKAYLGSKSLRYIETDIASKEYGFLKLLQCYVDVAVNTKKKEDALKKIDTYRKRVSWKEFIKKMNIVNVYNELLQSYVENWAMICKIRNWMQIDGVQFNYQTYAILLDALGKEETIKILGKDEWEKEVCDILKNKHSLQNLFTHTSINESQRVSILKTIRKIMPFFEISPVKTDLNSRNILLKNLYEIKNKLESQVEDLFSSETLKKKVEDQLELEKNFVVEVEAIKLNNANKPVANEKNKFIELKAKWKTQIHEKFLENLNLLEIEKSKKTLNLSIFLRSLPPEVIVDVMMQTIQNLVEYSRGYSPSTRMLYQIIGDQIHQRYQIAKKINNNVAQNTVKMFQMYCDWYLDPKGPAKNSRQNWQLLLQDYFSSYIVDTKEIEWPNTVKIAVGKFLYNIIIRHTKISINEDGPKGLAPVFYTLLRREHNNCVEEIKCHPIISKLFQKYGFDFVNFEANQVPMLCPPKPWKSVTHGAYLISPVDFIRSPKEFNGKKLDLRKISSKELYATFDALNSLQSVPWMINEPVLDVILEVFRDGGCEKLEVPRLPDMNTFQVEINPEMNAKQRLEEYKKKNQRIKERQNNYGLWCEALYKLSLANHYRGKIFWLPQNLDFRGRVYPIPPHLNHIGSDLYRSLFLFAKAKPLGPKGFDWLKIHTINLTGTHKKSSNEERLNYANEILPKILDSAEKPLTGGRWWVESEDRWQTLAACMEIKKVIESGNPETYLSHFPVHQDGSCNGLQHYAALGRDSIGARSVNLAPTNQPQDIYAMVARMVEEERVKDVEKGIEIAKILEGMIQRKVVKQTIMTTVYGVTQYGAKQQIAGKLKDIPDFPQEHIWPASKYLAKKIFECLKQMFNSAREIQDWFTVCAGIICAKKEYVQWFSPIGLPILQPYSKPSTKKDIEKGLSCFKPNSLKQKNAFPPNFIHSLDSTHMMLTALYCEQANLTFASIHDCFWTHPNSVDQLNEICREQFISLHSQSILENLSQFFVAHYISGKEDPKTLKVFTRLPKTGDFDINNVLNSVYFFN